MRRIVHFTSDVFAVLVVVPRFVHISTLVMHAPYMHLLMHNLRARTKIVTYIYPLRRCRIRLSTEEAEG